MAEAPPMKRRQTMIGNHPTCTSQSMEDAYESGDVIGTGSFGIIRKVTRRYDGAVLARKELNYGRMDERDLKQLTEEVNILEQLGQNDNIVRYHERFVDKPKNMLYILMEYCEGGDLSGVIQRCRKSGTYLSEDVVWAYLAQITLALYDCHTEIDNKGQRKAIILHRDIKPENVFLDKENNLKLGDFGLSKAMAQAAMTQTYVGTPYYMSPELINGQPYDVKSDIWALGCLIYELCAGHPPFHEARTQPELAVMIREGKIPDLPKPYTAHLGQVVKAMLKQNPKHRPNTSQIKALDNVKLQIRAIELRRATKELRLRDQLMSSREEQLIAREAAVLQREQAILLRESQLRQNAESLRDERVNFAQEVALARMEVVSGVDGGENRRPRDGNSAGGGSAGGSEEDVLARVARRPSMVPRRPLEERSSSGNNSTVPFPRLSSASSLMSLDDTPIKPRNSSLGRRLASKSMHDLSAAGQFGTPSSSPGLLSKDDNSAPSSPGPFGRRSESARPLTSPRHFDASSVPPSPPPFRPTAPTRVGTAPPAFPGYGTSSEDDVPSPFLKKADASRFPSAPAPLPKAASISSRSGGGGGPPRASRVSLGGKPSMHTRLLATRAQAQAGVDEVGRRLSAVHVRGKSSGL